jgi:serine protease Do
MLVAAADDPVEDIPQVLREVVDGAVARVRPSLVRIAVVSSYYADGRQMKSESFGSGVIVSPQGHVVTNHHVAGRALRLQCTLTSRERVEARLIGTDPLTDIAVIQLATRPEGYPAAEWGDSSSAQVGDLVLAMGSPVALSQSVTLGIVSNTEMVLPEWLQDFGLLMQEGEDVGALVRWLGHDAAIAGGNSGGPLVNLDGRIIGINEISIGLGGAIPSNLARQIADELIQNGEIRRGWIGLSAQPRLGQNGLGTGALVADVMAGSPADRAGFRSGDLLLSIAGQAVDVAFAEQMPGLNNLLASLPVGAPVAAAVVRDGKEYALSVVPERREWVAPPEHEFRDWGATGRDISYVLAKELRMPDTSGVLLTSIRPGGPLGNAQPAIMPGDVLISVGQSAVTNVTLLQTLTKSLLTKARGQSVPVLVEVLRDGQNVLSAASVGERDAGESPRELLKAWLPVETQVVTRAIAEQLRQPDLKGFRITQVFSAASPEAVELRTGDYVVAVDGEPLQAASPEDSQELAELIRQYKIGAVVELTVLRGNERLTVPVRLLPRPVTPLPSAGYDDALLEISVSPVVFTDRVRYQWPEDQLGVLVTDVQPGGWAAVANLRVGDLITGLNGQVVRSVHEYQAVRERLVRQQPDYLALRILRGIYTQFIEIRPQWQNASNQSRE